MVEILNQAEGIVEYAKSVVGYLGWIKYTGNKMTTRINKTRLRENCPTEKVNEKMAEIRCKYCGKKFPDMVSVYDCPCRYNKNNPKRKYIL